MYRIPKTFLRNMEKALKLLAHNRTQQRNSKTNEIHRLQISPNSENGQRTQPSRNAEKNIRIQQADQRQTKYEHFAYPQIIESVESTARLQKPIDETQTISNESNQQRNTNESNERNAPIAIFRNAQHDSTISGVLCTS